MSSEWDVDILMIESKGELSELRFERGLMEEEFCGCGDELHKAHGIGFGGCMREESAFFADESHNQERIDIMFEGLREDQFFKVERVLDFLQLREYGVLCGVLIEVLV